MHLGIEIGGTKLQLGVGAGDGSELVALERRDVNPGHGGAGIRDQIEDAGRALLERHDIERIGFGFGGPIDVTSGCVTTSHQIAGWDGFPLVEWSTKTLGRSTVIANDCDAAALAEARFGAGRGRRVVFFVTVGTGVGGGLVIDGRNHAPWRPACAEIGHLKPTFEADAANPTVESMASGRGIEHAARHRLNNAPDGSDETTNGDARDLLDRCSGDPGKLTGKIVAEAAESGNQIAQAVLNRACRALGWGIAQVLAIATPEVIVIGGGVSLMGEELFFDPLRREVARLVFAPLRDSYDIAPAQLGELVVVHGAIARAADG